MTHRMLAASIILIAVPGFAGPRAPSTETAQAAATAAPQTPAQKILTKDAEYIRLLTPPAGDDFLRTYSAGYRERAAEIETRIADVSDENLRGQARSDEWSRMNQKDRDKFTREAETTFNETKISYLQNHRDNLFEVGHITYEETNKVLVVTASPAAPLGADFRVPISDAAINQIYSKFHQMAAQEIDEMAREYVSKAGVGSTCSRNPDMCYKFKKEDVERDLRATRLVVVAQGDLEAQKIDRLLLVDYDTETVFLELDPHISALNNPPWRFSIQLVPTVAAEQPPPDTQPQPPVAAPAEPASSPEGHTENTKSANSAEAGANPPAPANVPPTRIRVPGNVTAASIITQTKPHYPPQARAGRIQGSVVLHAIIDKEGKISEVQATSGDPLLEQSALDAVRQWRYKPMEFNGEPTEVDTTITVTFSMGE